MKGGEDEVRTGGVSAGEEVVCYGEVERQMETHRWRRGDAAARMRIVYWELVVVGHRWVLWCLDGLVGFLP
jgi:hypothetical protein